MRLDHKIDKAANVEAQPVDATGDIMSKDQLFHALTSAKLAVEEAVWKLHVTGLGSLLAARGLGSLLAARLSSRLSSDHEGRRRLLGALHDLDDAVMNPAWKESK